MNKAEWYQNAVDQLLAAESLEDLTSAGRTALHDPPAGYAVFQITHLLPGGVEAELQRYGPLHTVTKLLAARRRRLKANQTSGEM